MLTRRRLLEFGALAALAAAGSVVAPVRAAEGAGAKSRALDPGARTIVAAIAPVMLAGALPAGDKLQAALRDVVQGTDAAVAALAPSVQHEVGQLFGLLGFPPTRYLVAGVRQPWDRADAADIERFLQTWRTSPFDKLRSAYDALHQLIGAAWYGNPASWSRVGYPGPPRLG